MAMKCPICDKKYVKPGWLRIHLHKSGTIDYKVLGGKLYKQMKLSQFVNQNL